MAVQNYGVHWHDNDTLLCFIAGILLGVIVSSRIYLFGKVTGISGMLSGSIEIKKEFWKDSFIPDSARLSKIGFVGGLIGGGGIASYYLPDCFEDWWPLPLERLIIGGLFVGFGTVMGNGCTSGHGVCGISNLSIRSVAATCTFMVASMIVAMAVDTSHFLPFFRNVLPVERSGAVIGVCIAICAAIVVISKFVRNQYEDGQSLQSAPIIALTFIFEIIFGIFFAMAMAVSNMTKLSATISFLDLRYWNPALAFIMGGSIAVAGTLMYFITKFYPNPMLDIKYYLRSAVEKSIIDVKLLLGATIFGIGWGLAGACPGPALVNVGSGNIPPLIYISCVIVGMWIHALVDPYITPYLQSKVLYKAQEDKVDNQPVVIPQKEETR